MVMRASVDTSLPSLNLWGWIDVSQRTLLRTGVGENQMQPLHSWLGDSTAFEGQLGCLAFIGLDIGQRAFNSRLVYQLKVILKWRYKRGRRMKN